MAFTRACRQRGIRPTPWLLWVQVRGQMMHLFRRPTWVRTNSPSDSNRSLHPGVHVGDYQWRRTFRVSTSRFGVGQEAHSMKTPLGLHRIARKVGAGFPMGTVFKGRQPIGLTWQGLPAAAIAHRLLWLEGLELGKNRGGNVDSFARYIYLHGVGNETTLGQPASRGCVHLAARDLLPLYHRLPVGTLVWIG